MPYTETVTKMKQLIEQTREKLHNRLSPDELTTLSILDQSLKQSIALFERSLHAGLPPSHDPAEEPEGRVTGPFNRLAKGGTIIGEDEEVFMPEIWVRKLGVEHGDWLAADPLGTLGDSMLYEFTVLERRSSDAPTKRVAVIGPLIYHTGEWFVFSREEEITITVNPREVRSLGLQEGDLVEVAYLEGDPSRARIAWKFEETNLEEVIRRRGKQSAAKTEATVDVADPLLSGRKILVVGGDLYKESFRQMFERRGAAFSWESGFQGGTGRNIESKVRSADIVVMVTEMMSHRLPNVEAMCHRHHKPFVYAPSKGSTGAVREVQQKLRLLQTKRG
ncbi:DUF2325 domain-containing protein [Desulforamulus ruminis]|uniref:DUF2325 domain-containing protein n=1 Tax=Desulforamulus ruminis (strain ATCC 23193 / DSM 2154 / NCIMB 8452 / DL) TaxID=696281 RepID=F6DSP0_DESRL|nr:DUF2325 domain-containing protein [Desulforamulus ruminis]AEG58859.1 hypothetical protein Desru_0574 [Desulforamulus ruminis DSM 2154]